MARFSRKRTPSVLSEKAYNRHMRPCGLAFALSLAVSCISPAKDKNPTPGHAENDAVSVDAVAYLDRNAIQQVLGSDLSGYYTVLQVTVTPKKGNLNIRRDDFLLRTDKDGEQTRPLAPSQVAGQSDMVLHQVHTSGTVGTQPTGPIWGGNPSIGQGPVQLPGNGGMGGNGSGGTTTTASVNKKKSSKEDPMLAVLKAKCLTEKDTSQPVSGLLVFDLEKQKLKDLELVYTTAAGPLKLRFR